MTHERKTNVEVSCEVVAFDPMKNLAAFPKSLFRPFSLPESVPEV